jgi:hypothetical protein
MELTQERLTGILEGLEPTSDEIEECMAISEEHSAWELLVFTFEWPNMPELLHARIREQVGRKNGWAQAHLASNRILQRLSGDN